MKKKTVFIGIDIGAEKFVITILTSKKCITEEFKNTEIGFEELFKCLKKNKVTPERSITVMESTGVYCEQICHFLYSKNYELCIETALKVKRSFDLSPKKSDIVDSKRIAEYAMRFIDKLELWQPPQQILEEVKSLLSLREHFVNQSTANKNILKALKKKFTQSSFAKEMLEVEITELKVKIKNIEKEIKNLLLSDKVIAAKYLCLISIPGVALLLASELLVLTNSFTKTVNHKEIASYLGICPHENSSGSIIKRPRSAGYGHPRIRKLIYLASCSVRTHNQDFRNYFLRKVSEGKKERMIINNIANKLIKLICGVIKSGKPFIQGFQSLHPALAA
jgi:transposase